MVLTWFHEPKKQFCLENVAKTQVQDQLHFSDHFMSLLVHVHCISRQIFLLRWVLTSTWGLPSEEEMSEVCLRKRSFLTGTVKSHNIVCHVAPSISLPVWSYMSERISRVRHYLSIGMILCLWSDCSVEDCHPLISLQIFYLGQILNTVTEEPMTSWSHKYYVLCFPITVYCFT